MKKIYILKTSILTTILFLNSGCFLNYFDAPKVEVKKMTKQPKESSIDLISTRTAPPSVECTNDKSSPCKKPPISPRELKVKKIIEQGEIHNLRSIQGQKIIIIDNERGFSFPQHKNKIVILELFGKNCSHCIKEMPIMGKLYRKYRNKLEIIAIQVEDRMSRFEGKRLLQNNHIKYPIIPGEDATNLQYNIQSTYGWNGILPYTMVIKNGVTEFTYSGEVSYKEINRDIRSILY